LFQRFEAGGGGSKLRFEILSLLRQCPYLDPNLPDFLIAIFRINSFSSSACTQKTLSIDGGGVNHGQT